MYTRTQQLRHDPFYTHRSLANRATVLQYSYINRTSIVSVSCRILYICIYMSDWASGYGPCLARPDQVWPSNQPAKVYPQVHGSEAQWEGELCVMCPHPVGSGRPAQSRVSAFVDRFPRYPPASVSDTYAFQGKLQRPTMVEAKYVLSVCGRIQLPFNFPVSLCPRRPLRSFCARIYYFI